MREAYSGFDKTRKNLLKAMEGISNKYRSRNLQQKETKLAKRRIWSTDEKWWEPG